MIEMEFYGSALKLATKDLRPQVRIQFLSTVSIFSVGAK